VQIPSQVQGGRLKVVQKSAFRCRFVSCSKVVFNGRVCEGMNLRIVSKGVVVCSEGNVMWFLGMELLQAAVAVYFESEMVPHLHFQQEREYCCLEWAHLLRLFVQEIQAV